MTAAGGQRECRDAYAAMEPSPPIIEILVDNTESMSNTAPSTGGQTKMACTRQALAAAFPNIPAEYAVGMTYYHVSTGPCNDSMQAVPIAPMTAAHFFSPPRIMDSAFRRDWFSASASRLSSGDR